MVTHNVLLPFYAINYENLSLHLSVSLHNTSKILTNLDKKVNFKFITSIGVTKLHLP